MDVTSFGALGDGRTDDTKAIGTALAALDAGQTLRFPAGRVFCHSDVLTVTTEGVQLVGPGRLLATAEQRSALQIDAPRVRLRNLTVAMGTTTQRWSAPAQHKVYLGAHPGIVVRDVAVVGSAAAGVFCDGTADFELDGVQVSGTRADGIHMTNGARNGVVNSPRITRSGDDGVAVVSYLQDGAPCHNITIRAPRVRTTTGGRGVSVVGGEHISYLDVDIAGSAAASVYVACESGDFVTASVRDVSISGGRIAGANTDGAIDHGAVLVYSGRSGGSVDDVRVSDLQITDTRSGASRQIGAVADGSDDLVSGVHFADLRLDAAPTPYQGNAPAAGITLTDVMAAGVPVRLPA